MCVSVCVLLYWRITLEYDGSRYEKGSNTHDDDVAADARLAAVDGGGAR